MVFHRSQSLIYARTCTYNQLHIGQFITNICVSGVYFILDENRTARKVPDINFTSVLFISNVYHASVSFNLHPFMLLINFAFIRKNIRIAA